MDVRLTAEQQQLRDAAAKLADDLGPGSVQDLADDESNCASGQADRDDGLAIAALRRRLRCRSGHRRRGVRPRTGRRPVPRAGARRRSGPPRRRRRRWRRRSRSTVGRSTRADTAVRCCWTARVLAVDLGAGRRRRGPDQGRRRTSNGTAADPSASWTPTPPHAGWHLRWPPRRRTWSARPAARTPWPAITRKSVSSTASRSAPTRLSRTCWRKVWR